MSYLTISSEVYKYIRDSYTPPFSVFAKDASIAIYVKIFHIYSKSLRGVDELPYDCIKMCGSVRSYDFPVVIDIKVDNEDDVELLTQLDILSADLNLFGVVVGSSRQYRLEQPGTIAYIPVYESLEKTLAEAEKTKACLGVFIQNMLHEDGTVSEPSESELSEIWKYLRENGSDLIHCRDTRTVTPSERYLCTPDDKPGSIRVSAIVDDINKAMTVTYGSENHKLINEVVESLYGYDRLYLDMQSAKDIVYKIAAYLLLRGDVEKDKGIPKVLPVEVIDGDRLINSVLETIQDGTKFFRMSNLVKMAQKLNSGAPYVECAYIRKYDTTKQYLMSHNDQRPLRSKVFTVKYSAKLHLALDYDVLGDDDYSIDLIRINETDLTRIHPVERFVFENRAMDLFSIEEKIHTLLGKLEGVSHEKKRISVHDLVFFDSGKDGEIYIGYLEEEKSEIDCKLYFSELETPTVQIADYSRFISPKIVLDYTENDTTLDFHSINNIQAVYAMTGSSFLVYFDSMYKGDTFKEFCCKLGVKRSLDTDIGDSMADEFGQRYLRNKNYEVSVFTIYNTISMKYKELPKSADNKNTTTRIVIPAKNL